METSQASSSKEVLSTSTPPVQASPVPPLIEVSASSAKIAPNSEKEGNKAGLEKSLNANHVPLRRVGDGNSKDFEKYLTDPTAITTFNVFSKDFSSRLKMLGMLTVPPAGHEPSLNCDPSFYFLLFSFLNPTSSFSSATVLSKEIGQFVFHRNEISQSKYSRLIEEGEEKREVARNVFDKDQILSETSQFPAQVTPHCSITILPSTAAPLLVAKIQYADAYKKGIRVHPTTVSSVRPLASPELKKLTVNHPHFKKLKAEKLNSIHNTIICKEGDEENSLPYQSLLHCYEDWHKRVFKLISFLSSANEFGSEFVETLKQAVVDYTYKKEENLKSPRHTQYLNCCPIASTSLEAPHRILEKLCGVPVDIKNAEVSIKVQLFNVYINSDKTELCLSFLKKSTVNGLQVTPDLFHVWINFYDTARILASNTGAHLYLSRDTYMGEAVFFGASSLVLDFCVKQVGFQSDKLKIIKAPFKISYRHKLGVSETNMNIMHIHPMHVLEGLQNYRPYSRLRGELISTNLHDPIFLINLLALLVQKEALSETLKILDQDPETNNNLSKKLFKILIAKALSLAKTSFSFTSPSALSFAGYKFSSRSPFPIFESLSSIGPEKPVSVESSDVECVSTYLALGVESRAHGDIVMHECTQEMYENMLQRTRKALNSIFGN